MSMRQMVVLLLLMQVLQLQILSASAMAISTDKHCKIVCSTNQYPDLSCLCAECPRLDCSSESLSFNDEYFCQAAKTRGYCSGIFSNVENQTFGSSTVTSVILTSGEVRQSWWSVVVLISFVVLAVVVAIGFYIMCKCRNSRSQNLEPKANDNSEAIPMTEGFDSGAQSEVTVRNRLLIWLNCCCTGDKKDSSREDETERGKNEEEAETPLVTNNESTLNTTEVVPASLSSFNSVDEDDNRENPSQRSDEDPSRRSDEDPSRRSDEDPSRRSDEGPLSSVAPTPDAFGNNRGTTQATVHVDADTNSSESVFNHVPRIPNVTGETAEASVPTHKTHGAICVTHAVNESVEKITERLTTATETTQAVRLREDRPTSLPSNTALDSQPQRQLQHQQPQHQQPQHQQPQHQQPQPHPPPLPPQQE